MFEVVGALIMVALQQPLLAVVTLAVTPALSRVLRSIVVRSSGIMYQRQQVLAGTGLSVDLRREGLHHLEEAATWGLQA